MAEKRHSEGFLMLNLKALKLSRSVQTHWKTIVPLSCTFANAFLGFLSIVKTLEHNYTHAVYCLVLAAIMDMLDGRLARALGSTTQLGGELDSLADAISFCLAPCIALYACYPGTVGYSGMLALGLYLCAGMFRLAKFNLCNGNNLSYFTGLPTPVAAFCITSIILASQRTFGFMLYKRVPFIVITSIAFLMVSSIRFPSIKTIKIPRTAWLAVIPAALLTYYVGGAPIMLMTASLYLSIGIIGSLRK